MSSECSFLYRVYCLVPSHDPRFRNHIGAEVILDRSVRANECIYYM